MTNDEIPDLSDEEIYKLQVAEYEKEQESGEWYRFWSEQDKLQSQLSEAWENWAISRYGSVPQALNAIARRNNYD